jgi:hypothetical protein
MKRAIVLGAIALAIVWVGSATASVEDEVARAKALLAGTYPMEFAPRSASSGHSVTVASAAIPVGGAGTIGIYLTNDEPIRCFVIPLVIRSIDEGSFITHMSAEYDGTSRLNGYLNGEYQDTVYIKPIINLYAFKDPPVDMDPWYGQAIGYREAPSEPDYISPDGLMLVRMRILSENDLPAGSDGTPEDGTPMITIDLEVNYQPGRFEIDTCVIAPNNLIQFITTTNPRQWTFPQFTKGIVTIYDPNEPALDRTGHDLPELSTDGLKHAEHGTGLESQSVLGNGIKVHEPFEESVDEVDDRRPHRARGEWNDYDGISNYPNPFNASTNIRYTLHGRSRVSLTVYDLLGRRVRTLVDAIQEPGDYEIPWDACNASGVPVATGIYFYRFEKGHFKSVGKMLLLK